MISPSPFASILRLARAGATEAAWARLAAHFEPAGMAGADADPAALTLKGRLLKDRADAAAGDARISLLQQSAAAYLAASRIAPATYPLINAATLALLGGDAPRSAAMADHVLALLDAGDVANETPYWIAATRAEALILLGRQAEARSALAEAVAIAPLAYEDHAATLRQLTRIAEYRGEDASWLALYRPPPALYFDGVMGINPSDAEAVQAIQAAVDSIKPSAAFGALAAGADILIAESVLAQGGQIGIVLPCTLDMFIAHSVAPLGADWLARFDALIAQAEPLILLDEAGGLSAASLLLAQDMARGLARQHAARIASRMVQLHVHLRTDRAAQGPADHSGGIIRVSVDVGALTALPVAPDPADPHWVLGWQGGAASQDEGADYAAQNWLSFNRLDDAMKQVRAMIASAPDAVLVLDRAALTSGDTPPPALARLLAAVQSMPHLGADDVTLLCLSDAAALSMLAQPVDAQPGTAKPQPQPAGQITDMAGDLPYYVLVVG
jgi:hypothetical protein